MSASDLQPIENRQDAHVPEFVPEIIRGAQLNFHKLLKINWIDGAGRGNRTPMELPPTDFELLMIIVSL